MWKVKLDDDVWLAKDSATTPNEDEAWLFPDMPSVQTQLKKVRRFMPYPNALVIFDDGQPQPHQNHTTSGHMDFPGKG